MDDQRLIEISQWVYRHYPAEKNVWWVAPILVVHEDAQHLRVSINEAEDTLSELQKRRIVQRDETELVLHADQKFPKYYFIESGRSKLREFAKVPWYYRFIPSKVAYRIERLRYLTIVCLALIATSFFQGVFGKVGEALGDYIKKHVFGA
jgi:hypothetical protein